MPVIIRALDGLGPNEEYTTITDAFDGFFHNVLHCDRAGPDSLHSHATIMKEHATRLVREHLFSVIFPVGALD